MRRMPIRNSSFRLTYSDATIRNAPMQPKYSDSGRRRCLALVAALGLVPAARGQAAGNPAGVRAATPVTVAARGETIDEILLSLGRQAGVEIGVGSNSTGRRLYLFAEKKPLLEVMDRVGDVMACPPGEALWFKSGSATRFDEDLASKNARQRAVTKLLKQRIDAGKAAMRRVRRWVDDMGPFDQALERQRAGKSKGQLSPYHTWMQGMWLRILEVLPPHLQERVFLGIAVRLPSASLPHQVRTACRDAEKGSPYKRSVPRSPQAPDVKYTLSITPSQGTRFGRPSASITIVEEGKNGGSSFPDVLKICKANPDGSAIYSDFEKPDSSDERRRGPAGMEKIAALQGKVKIPARSEKETVAPRLLPAVAGLLKMPLIGEFDPCVMQSFLDGSRHLRPAVHLIRAEPRPMPAWKLIERVCQAFDFDWDYTDGWIIIKSPRAVLSWGRFINLDPVPLP